MLLSVGGETARVEVVGAGRRGGVGAGGGGGGLVSQRERIRSCIQGGLRGTGGLLRSKLDKELGVNGVVRTLQGYCSRVEVQQQSCMRVKSSKIH